MPALLQQTLKIIFASLLAIGLLASCGDSKNAGSVPPDTKLLAQSSPVVPQSGWWWNPAEGGRGFTLEVQNGSMFMAGYLYDESGRASWYAAGPTAMSGSTFNATLTSYRGGQTLGGTYHSVTGTAGSGNISIVFTDPSHGTMTWPGGVVPIQRYDIVPGGASATPPAGTPDTGWWWNANEGGRGFSIEIQNGSMFLAGYMYDDAGNPIWYASGPTPMTNATTYQGTLQQYGNGQTLTGAYKSAAVVANVGNVSVRFIGSRTATLTLPNGTSIAMTRYDFNGLAPTTTTTTATTTTTSAGLTVATLSSFTITTKVFGNSPFTPTPPTSASNGAITYTSDTPGVATVNSTTGQITIVGVGMTTITATQAATTTYTSSSSSATFTVNGQPPTLGTFGAIHKYTGDAPFGLAAPTSNSPGAFSYGSGNTAVATISGSTVTIVGAGSSIITATQSANGNFASGSTTANLTVTLPTCSDTAKNGGETDIDCGGATCPHCSMGKSCNAGSDCSSSVCSGHTCHAPLCTDSVKNGSETDIDCGGGTCSSCSLGLACTVNSDCFSNNCTSGTCH